MAIAYGHIGEIVQGRMSDYNSAQEVNFLMSLPAPKFFSKAYFFKDSSSELKVFPNDKIKALKAVNLFGLNYVGLDIAYPYVIEFNIVNPRGIADLDINHEVPQPKIIETIESILNAVQV